MKNKLTIFLSLLFLGINYTLVAGCGTGYLAIKNVYIGYTPGDNNPTLFLNPNDSSLLMAKQVGNCSPNSAKIIGILFNGASICNSTIYSIKLKNNPGQYDVKISYMIGAITYTPTLSYYISDQTAVGIAESGDINSGLVLFPNPASSSVRIESMAAFKSVSIFDATGRQLNVVPANGSELIIPLDHYPQGIYFVQVATEAEKVVIKKLVVE